METIPLIEPVLRANGVRYFAHRVPANNVYVEKIVLTAMPDETDACPKVIGSLTLNAASYPPHDDLIEWIEVDPEYRRKGIGTALWTLAEHLTGRKLEHMGVTPDGEAFEDALLKRGIGC